MALAGILILLWAFLLRPSIQDTATNAADKKTAAQQAQINDLKAHAATEAVQKAAKKAAAGRGGRRRWPPRRPSPRRGGCGRRRRRRRPQGGGRDAREGRDNNGAVTARHGLRHDVLAVADGPEGQAVPAHGHRLPESRGR